VKLYDSILQVLFSSSGTPVIQETMEFCECRTSENSGLQPDIKSGLLTLLPVENMDHFTITVTIDTKPISFVSGQADNSNFFQEWNKFKINEDGDEVIESEIRVHKVVHDKRFIHVYNSVVFFNYLCDLPLNNFLKLFSKHFTQYNQFFFIHPEFEHEFYTDSIFFIKSIDRIPAFASAGKNHKDAWGKLSSVCNFTGIENCVVLPEDFDLSDEDKAPENIVNRFRFAGFVLMLSILYDYSELKSEEIYIKLNGYKTFSATHKLVDVNPGCYNSYRDIYHWTNNGGSLNDKMGLVRNLISLNLNINDCYTIGESVFHSIQSGFKVYERQNIKQYIELRNKMSDQLIGFNERAGKIVENFASSFQKSVLGVVSLYASFIITRVLTSHAISAVFTFDATVLSFVFLIISFLYYLVCRWEIREQKIRFVNSYQNMKKRNLDLLTFDDIVKILNDDAEYKSDLKFIDEKKKKYSLLWILVIGLLGFATIFLHVIFRVQNG
jgi:hypothetical protein